MIKQELSTANVHILSAIVCAVEETSELSYFDSPKKEFEQKRIFKESLEIGLEKIDLIVDEAPNIVFQLGLRLIHFYMNDVQYNLATKAHEVIVDRVTSKMDAESIYFADFLDGVSWFYSEILDYEKVLELRQESYRIFSEIMGEDHKGSLLREKFIALNLLNLGRMHDARKICLKLSDISDSSMLTDSERAGWKHDLGAAYYDLHEYVTAIDHLKASVNISFNTDLHLYSISMEYLGRCYRELKDYEAAIKCIKVSAEIKKRLLGDTHHDYARSIRSLGAVYMYSGRLDEAEKLLNEALRIREEVYGEENDYTLNILVALRELYYKQGRHEKAASTARRTIDISLRMLPVPWKALTVSLGFLCVVHQELCEYGDLEKYCDLLSSKEIDTHLPFGLNSIGLLFYYCGRYQEAESFYMRALENSNAQSFTTATIFNNLGKLYDDLAQYQESLKYHRRALKLWRKLLDDSDDLIARSLHNHGLLFSHQNEVKKARSFFEQALSLRVENLGFEHQSTLETKAELDRLN